MSTRQHDVKLAEHPTAVFDREIRNNGDVCDNCYRLLFERVGVPRMITDFREAAPDSIRSVNERNVEDDPAGLFCRCGSDGGAQIDERPRDKTTVSHHARNLSRTLGLLGFDVHERKLVQHAVELKERAGEDGEMMDDAFAEAVSKALKNDDG